MTGIAVYGGTFNPIHNGHLSVAKCAADELPVSEVRLIPNWIPPHKSYDGDARMTMHRLEMLRIAAEGHVRLTVDDREIRRGGLSYTYETLSELKEELGEDVPLFFIIGEDSFFSLQEWRNPGIIMSLATIVVAKRDFYTDEQRYGHAQELIGEYGGHITFLSMPVMPVSSAEIRSALAEGRDVSRLVPASVYAYIKEHHLYEPKQEEI